MSETEEVVGRPSLLARTVAHILIGLAVTGATKMVFRQNTTVAIVAGILAFALHENLDAPVARKLSQLGL